MIVHTISWKTRGFHRLVDYINKEMDRSDDETVRVLHNLRYTEDDRDLAAQFFENDVYRPERKNGVVCYHEIISFSPDDAPHLTPDIVEDLTQTYLDLRAPDALAYAGTHHDKEHLHVHLLISGNVFHGKKATRLSRSDFLKVRRDLERIQQERYPQLRHSLIFSRTKDRMLELEEVTRARAYRDQEVEGSSPSECDDPSADNLNFGQRERVSNETTPAAPYIRSNNIERRQRELEELICKKQERELSRR